MGWSVTIGAIAGTKIRLHITFLLFLVWIFFASYWSGGSVAAWQSLAFMLLLFACVVAHEFGHIFMARRFGVTTPTVTLLPIGGVAQLERIPEKPWEEFLIAVAGPAVNVVIAAVLVLLFDTAPESRHLTVMENPTISIVDRLVMANVFLVLFNLIPAFPMDGGRVLRAALASRLGYTRATEIAATIGQWLAFGLGFARAVRQPAADLHRDLRLSRGGIGIAARFGARDVARCAGRRRDDHAVQHAHAQRADRRGDRDAVAHHAERISGGRRCRPAGWRAGTERADPRAEAARARCSRADAMTAPVPTIGHRAWLDEAFRILQEKSAPAVGVVDGTGRLVGLITSETIGEMLMVRDALPEGVRFGPWSRPAGA